MFKWLFIIPLIVFIDPFLLYCAWPYLNFYVQVAVLVVYPLAATFYTRSKPVQDGDLVTRTLRKVERFMLWYPGPIIKTLSFILLIPPIERALARSLTQRFQQHILKSIARPNSSNSANPGNPFYPSGQSGSASPLKKPLPSDENLKRARGEVIE